MSHREGLEQFPVLVFRDISRSISLPSSEKLLIALDFIIRMFFCAECCTYFAFSHHAVHTAQLLSPRLFPPTPDERSPLHDKVTELIGTEAGKFSSACHHKCQGDIEFVLVAGGGEDNTDKKNRKNNHCLIKRRKGTSTVFLPRRLRPIQNRSMVHPTICAGVSSRIHGSCAPCNPRMEETNHSCVAV